MPRSKKITGKNPCIFFLSLCLFACSGKDPHGSMAVMTLNARYDNPADAPNDWRSRCPLIIRTILDESADIIGFQEVLKNQLDDLDSLLPGYSHVGVARDDGREAGEFSPVFYKKDRFEVIENGTFWLSMAPEDTGSIGWDAALPRIVTWARFRDMQLKRDGMPFEFYFLNTHLDHAGDTARLESARLILDFIQNHTMGLSVLLTGDFNFDPSQEPYALLTRSEKEWPGLRDACRSSHPGAPCNIPTFNGFGNATQGQRIDFIFTTDNWNILRFETLMIHEDGIFISDHYPVIAGISAGTSNAIRSK